MLLDGSAIENLEIVKNNEGYIFGTLFSVIDFCKTPFGKRLLYQWICNPLKDIALIKDRQLAINDFFITASENCDKAYKILKGVCDLDRGLNHIYSIFLDKKHSFKDSDHIELIDDAINKKVKPIQNSSLIILI